MQSKGHYSFPKAERLCSRRLRDLLFAEGRRLTVFPYSVRWLLCEEGELPEGVRMQVLVAAPKRRLHRAVDRNRVKRLTRECYRLERGPLGEMLAREGVALVLSVSYVHTEIFAFSVLVLKMRKVLEAVGSGVQEVLSRRG